MSDKMAAIEKYLGCEGAELLKEATRLSEVESKNDPQNAPYKSKYEAREIYKELSNKVKDKQEDVDGFDGCINLLSLCIDLLIGQNYVDTDETAEGEDYFLSILKTLKENTFEDSVHISLNIHVLNSLGIVSSARGDLDKCMQYFTEAETLFHDYRSTGKGPPTHYHELLEPYEGAEDEKAHKRNVAFESLHTHTLYYLAQGYAKKESNSRSAHYCHITLHRQLNAGDYNPIDWGLNAVTLSQYYITVERFNEARHCLGSGSHIFDSSKSDVSELSEEEKELQDQRDVDIKRCWIKYGLALLESSRDKMLSEIEDNQEENEASSNQDAVDNSNSEHQEVSSSDKEKDFEEFKLELTAYEESITDKLVRTFDEARKIFLFIIDKISKAKFFYSFDTHACDYVELTQDNSKAYKLLAFFELDMDRQCKMHKRRVDMLSDILKELNPKYYLLVCRQIMFELAETYSSMVDLKASILEMDRSRLSQQSVVKFNKLVEQSIYHYQMYIDSLRDSKSNLPEEFPEGDVRPALVAYFCMGRLYSKFLEPDFSKRISLMTKSVDHYKCVIDYCTAHPQAIELVASEYSICKEMVDLLPLKIERLKQHGVSS